MQLKNPWPRSMRGQELAHAARKMRESRLQRRIHRDWGIWLRMMTESGQMGERTVRVLWDSWMGVALERQDEIGDMIFPGRLIWDARACPDGWVHTILKFPTRVMARDVWIGQYDNQLLILKGEAVTVVEYDPVYREAWIRVEGSDCLWLVRYSDLR